VAVGRRVATIEGARHALVDVQLAELTAPAGLTDALALC
jgi:hypothetical protein